MAVLRPPAMMPKIKPATVQKLTKVSPAERHFIGTFLT
jgi:hypothetical protein